MRTISTLESRFQGTSKQTPFRLWHRVFKPSKAKTTSTLELFTGRFKGEYYFDSGIVFETILKRRSFRLLNRLPNDSFIESASRWPKQDWLESILLRSINSSSSLGAASRWPEQDGLESILPRSMNSSSFIGAARRWPTQDGLESILLVDEQRLLV